MALASLPASQVAGPFTNLYEKLWRQIDSTGTGSVSAGDAAAFLKRSKLPENTLHEIWSVADYQACGSLDKKGFFMALRLVTAAQSGVSPGPNVLTMPATSPPSFEGVTAGSPSGGKALGATSTATFASPSDLAKYEGIFQSMQPSDGRLSGDKVKPVLMNSNLPVSVLGQIWELADSNHDGFLTKEDFCVCMHLTYRALDGDAVPNVVPAQLRSQLSKFRDRSRSPPSGGRVSLGNVSVSSLAPSNRSGSPASIHSGGWVVSSEDQKTFEQMFYKIDVEKKNFVTGEDVKSMFVATGLPSNILAHIWGLCDINSQGKLTMEQFMLAMHFAKQKRLNNVDPPQALSAEMVPPSMNRMSIASEHGSVASTGTLSGQGIEELASLSKEIDQLSMEKEQCTEEVTKKHGQLASCREEVLAMQQQVSQAQAQLGNLEKQKQELSASVSGVESELSQYEVQLAGIKEKCRTEETEIASLKSQLSNQQSTLQSQQDQLRQAKDDVARLLREEQELKSEVAENRSALSSAETTLAAAKAESAHIRSRIGSVAEAHKGVTLQLQQIQTGPSGSNSDDPFSSSAALSDPFKSDDPFGKSDPFGSSTADPFKSVASEDPFGSSALSFAPSGSRRGSTAGVDQPDLFSSTASGGTKDNDFFSSATGGDLFSSSAVPANQSGLDPFGSSAGGNKSDPFGSSPTQASASGGATDPFGSSAATQASASGGAKDPFGASSATFDQFSSPTSSEAKKDLFAPFGNDKPSTVMSPSGTAPAFPSTSAFPTASVSTAFPSDDPFGGSLSTTAATSSNASGFDAFAAISAADKAASSTTSPTSLFPSGGFESSASAFGGQSDAFGGQSDAFGGIAAKSNADPFAAFGDVSSSDAAAGSVAPFSSRRGSSKAAPTGATSSGASPFGDDPFGAGGF